MKSYAARVRDMLVREGDPRPDTRDTRQAELTGLALTCGTITLLGGGNLRLTLRAEHAGTARLAVRLLRRGFGVMPALRILRTDRLGGQTFFEVAVEGETALRVTEALGLTPLTQAIPKVCLRSRRSRDALLRGMFLGCGTMTNPERGYQMEFLCAGEGMARSLMRFLGTFYGVRAGLHVRKGAYVVYLREGDAIIRVLSGIGAHGAILEMENVRITKDARNRANRAANCDSGNITKMLGAAERQLEAIDLIERTIGLDALPDTLREIAVERRLHEDLSLEALGALLEPPVGKSGVHHRLSRIEALARTIAEQREEEK